MAHHPFAKLAVALYFTACVDPEASFEDFARRSAHSKPDGDAGADGGPCTVVPGAVEGQYLLALSVTLAPTKPIVALASLSTPRLDGGTGLSLAVQPLRASDRTTPVGAPITLGPFAIAADGTYRVDVPDVVVTGEANAISGGDIETSLSLVGSLCGDGQSFCGSLGGTVTQPLAGFDLAGSTFTFTRVQGPLPTQPAIDCAGTLADPL
jgi:hypothetical protein